MNASSIKIVSDGDLTKIEVDGVEMKASAVCFQHVAGQVPTVILELPCEELELQTTDTFLVKETGSRTVGAVQLPDEIMGNEQT